MILEKMPSDLTAERYLLGSLMIDDAKYPLISAFIEANDFSIEKHRRIFASMSALWDRGERIDRVTVADALMRANQLESVDGLGYITSLDDGMPEVANLDSYARIVKDKAALRGIIFAAQRLIDRCVGNESAEQVLADARPVMAHLEASAASRGSLRSAERVMLDYPGGIDEFLKPSRSPGIPLPWSSLNLCLVGMQPGQFLILAARPSVGKTAAALQIARHAAERGDGVAFFSLEMPPEQLLQRTVCAAAEVSLHAFRNGRLTPLERARLSEEASRVADLPLHFDNSSWCTVGAIFAAVRKLRAKQRVDLVVVDYLQLMTILGKVENKNAEVSQISRALKILAGELEIPVLVLSQLNRAVESEKRRPQLSDLRDSGSLEQDADVVMFLHRSGVRTDAPSEPIELIVAKHRQGPPASLRMFFFKQQLRFEEAAE